MNALFFKNKSASWVGKNAKKCGKKRLLAVRIQCYFVDNCVLSKVLWNILIDAWLYGLLIVYMICLSGLLPDSVPPLQTSAAVCAGYGTGGHAAAPGLVWFSLCTFIWKLSGDLTDDSIHNMLDAAGSLTPCLSVCTRRIVNDTYRTDLCLLYPPFMIALGKICPCAFCHHSYLMQLLF